MLLSSYLFSNSNFDSFFILLRVNEELEILRYDYVDKLHVLNKTSKNEVE